MIIIPKSCTILCYIEEIKPRKNTIVKLYTEILSWRNNAGNNRKKKKSEKWYIKHSLLYSARNDRKRGGISSVLLAFIAVSSSVISRHCRSWLQRKMVWGSGRSNAVHARM